MLDFTGILPGYEGITFRKEKCTGTDKWISSYRDSYKASKEEQDWLCWAKKKPGRPEGSKNKSVIKEQEAIPVEGKRKRGRPKGSKNKPKLNDTATGQS